MLLWSKCPKHKFHGRKTVEIAVTSAIINYNSGATGKYQLMHAINIPSGSHSVTHSTKKDKKRLKNARNVHHWRQRRIGSQGEILERRLSTRKTLKGYVWCGSLEDWFPQKTVPQLQKEQKTLEIS